jgi:hypothetical protein
MSESFKTEGVEKPESGATRPEIPESMLRAPSPDTIPPWEKVAVPEKPDNEQHDLRTQDIYENFVDLPHTAIETLEKMGYSPEEIAKVSQNLERHKPQNFDGRSTYYPPVDDKAFDTANKKQADYLEGGYKENLECSDRRKDTAELVAGDPERAERVAKNLRLLNEQNSDGRRKVGFKYENGCFITNMDDYAAAKTDVRASLGIDIYPAFRRPDGQDDPSGARRPGAERIADLCVAIDRNKLDPTDIDRARALSQKIYSQFPNYSSEELKEFRAIVNKVPDYTYDGLVVHEDQDGHTFYYVHGEGFHPDGEGSGGLSHTGGHSVINEALNIRKNDIPQKEVPYMGGAGH